MRVDTVNILLAAAAYEFKRAMKALLDFIKTICEILFADNISLKGTF
ncbi:hypothetical protein PGTDC60_0749 [Porphyromonas gingivalis TDC60]|uniref:Uncharacterized protein n=2 Tax=Porphyromonas gingivalis TaxID=837 RepID=B2RI83_PORG3|nr:hypothetical protein PGS_00005330 [Porphyromonas gingivalis A7A1-28]ERJ65573.1 hypothetical protein HMPREF1553_02091 [Porphyromonas gingivalis F0568]ERJ68188.1 hypothetical protein HMPREF1555_00527 [Porphyromonas gingivalis F0570]ERJ71343.1 hypothetical protein HMPREF1554_00217 [Porphyromonas gingivalis F0569]ERJ85859.1 hypothetical protein HMPREF1990_02096 [Porphyromonas gingivalis W4087]OWR77205.1 hypothetical protein SJDPG11_08030 [Porphyromonas gingivalis SJD11]OWR83050.1 hypothetical 